MRAQVRRGQPLVVLGLILTGWIAVRVAILQTPLGLAVRSEQTTAPQTIATLAETRPADSAASAAVATPPAANPPDWAPAPAPLFVAPLQPAVGAATAPPPPAMRQPEVPVRIAAGHQLLFLAALAQLPLPPELATPRGPSAVAPAPPSRTASKRWSADAWLLWRRGSAGAIGSGPGPASYGASQAGAVIRYRLAPASPHRPVAYLRASSALRQPRDQEVALGLAARPFARVPIVAMVEVRASRQGSAETVRPAAALITEFPRLYLPLGARAEIYAQAGYVGGKAATAFIDGQVRVDRRVAQRGEVELRAGGGAWSGAQRGAARLDLGPSAMLGVPVGEGGARLALDWRFRVAGDAAPTSGPALTLSAGF